MMSLGMVEFKVLMKDVTRNIELTDIKERVHALVKDELKWEVIAQ